MTKPNKARCPRCGFSGLNLSAGLCPKCGADMRKKSIPAFFMRKGFYVPVLLFFLTAGGMSYLFYSNEGVANELRQIRQPRPSRFFVGIDVSATISQDSLEKFKDSLIDRLRQFIGDSSVSYEVFTFGNPGCASRSFKKILSTQSPEDETAFSWKVEEKIRSISITKVSPREIKPLTTPLYLFLEMVLPQWHGARIIIFSDLLNDDSDCRGFTFPEAAIAEFGEDKGGQMIFLYPAPHESRKADQQAFISQMAAMNHKGKSRVYFYHIPDDPLKRLRFMRSQLKNTIPATTFDLVWERASKVVYSIVSAVRG